MRGFCACLRVYLEQPLEAALLDGLGRQDVGQLSVGVRHQQAWRHKLANKLGDPSLWTGWQRGGWRQRRRRLQLAALAWRMKGKHTTWWMEQGSTGWLEGNIEEWGRHVKDKENTVLSVKKRAVEKNLEEVWGHQIDRRGGKVKWPNS